MKICTLVFAFFICLNNLSADKAEIEIVSSLPISGSSYAQTKHLVNAFNMAFDAANKGDHKFTIKYSSLDDATPQRGFWDPALEASNAEYAISNPKILAYIGTYNSGAAKISMPKTNKAGLLMISPSNTWPGLTKSGMGEANEPAVYRPSGKINYYRVVPTDDIQGPVTANFIHEKNFKSVYVLHDRESAGQGLVKIFEAEAKKLGLNVIASEGLDYHANNFRSLAVKVKQSNPDVVYFTGATQTGAAQLAKDLRAVGYKNPLVLPDGCFNDDLIQSAGAKNLDELTYVTFGGIPAEMLGSKALNFVSEYKKRFNEEPDGYALYAYEVASLLIDALDRSTEFSRTELIKQVAATKDFSGLLGTWSFDANGDINIKRMGIYQIQAGKFKFLKTMNLP